MQTAQRTRTPETPETAQAVDVSPPRIGLQGAKTEYIVEFWPKAPKDVIPGEIPQATECGSLKAAIELEKKFHDIGWTARQLTLVTTTTRNL